MKVLQLHLLRVRNGMLFQLSADLLNPISTHNFCRGAGKTKGRIAVEPEYRHQVSFLDTTLSLLRQATEYIPQLTP
jgi:hypothetical protein